MNENLEALLWANVVKNTLPLYCKDCDVLDDLESFLRRIGNAAAPLKSELDAEYERGRRAGITQVYDAELAKRTA